MTDIKDKNVEIELGGGSTLPKRENIPVLYRWKLEDIYSDDANWEKDFKSAKKRLPEINAYKGRLDGSVKIMLECFKLRDEISVTLGKLIVYAHMKSHEDTALPLYQGMADRAGTLLASFGAALSFFRPEVLAAGRGRVEEFLAASADDEGVAPF